MSNIYKNKRELIEKEIDSTEAVLDVGFLGQGVTRGDHNWPHQLIKNRTKDTYGLDLEIPQGKDFPENRYFEGSAESFNLPISPDIIFAGDLIEHLSNPGLFLGSSSKHLKPNGKLIITTPNCFSLFNLAEKLTKTEPTVNKDHTCYFNLKTLTQLLNKNGWQVESVGYIYTLDVLYKESWKKKLLNLIYNLVSHITPKFLETIVVIAKKQ